MHASKSLTGQNMLTSSEWKGWGKVGEGAKGGGEITFLSSSWAMISFLRRWSSSRLGWGWNKEIGYSFWNSNALNLAFQKCLTKQNMATLYCNQMLIQWLDSIIPTTSNHCSVQPYLLTRVLNAGCIYPYTSQTPQGSVLKLCIVN